MNRLIRQNIGPTMVVLTALLLWACTPVAPKALFLDRAAWPGALERIALVTVSYDRRYRPPPGLDLTGELRRVLKQELAAKGYQLLLVDRGEEIYRGEARAVDLAALAPQEADAVLALHIDFLFLSATLSERNPPPEGEIAGEARLIDKQSGKELWRDRGIGQSGGESAFPVISHIALRQEALANLARELFASLPDRVSGQ
ncbi:hypothetical protein A7E78_10580 [Syntrophotalea acetylenivorans]|uniref:Uncharacterized protein n=1 Tax=Syntrophotalea acetylenivorans TaxID=1842532 RepID=A0A1L3GQR2_9BACT|nr:hypothetical protein [Syntrophotalea acetylenivorans]APG28253.1 hypothetical protein A7E78_10580 [Syntrophotalea acetylenivorans]